MHREDNGQTGWTRIALVYSALSLSLPMRRVDIGGVEEEEVRQAGALTREQEKADGRAADGAHAAVLRTILPWLFPRAVRMPQPSVTRRLFALGFRRYKNQPLKIDGRPQRAAAAPSLGVGQLAAGSHVTGQRSHTGPSHPIRGREGERERGGE